jgi:hypothetical protein
MINRVQLLMDNNKIILHDEHTIKELENFVKKRSKSGTIKMEAKGKGHDDLVMSLAIYAASLDQRGMTGERRIGFHIL